VLSSILLRGKFSQLTSTPASTADLSYCQAQRLSGPTCSRNEFRQRFAMEIERWGVLIKEANIKL